MLFLCLATSQAHLLRTGGKNLGSKKKEEKREEERATGRLTLSSAIPDNFKGVGLL